MKRIEVVTTSKGKQTATSGRATRVEGRSATISLRSTLQGETISSVYTIGKECPTNAEQQRAAIILMALQRTITILQQPFVQSIWFPSERPAWSTTMVHRATPSICFPYRPLNHSQVRAVNKILSDRKKDCVTVIQGPPGTGKTTVIAASVTSLMASPSTRTMWLVAQSNVAVKNIAEKLADVEFLDFKLLVSKDFRFDWFVHLCQLS